MILQPNNPTHPIHHGALNQPTLPPESSKSLCSWEFRVATVSVLNANTFPLANIWPKKNVTLQGQF